MQKYIVSVSAIVYKPDISFLLIERSEEEVQGAGLLSYPGGKVENIKVKSIDEVKHDILQKTIRRELSEECGVEIEEDLILLDNHIFKRFDGHYSLMIVFLASFKSQKQIKLDKHEVKAIHWVGFQDIDKTKMYDTVYKVYKIAYNRLKDK